MSYRKRFQITPGRRVKLGTLDPRDHGGLRNKVKAERLLAQGIDQLSLQQDRLYAQNTWAVLVIFQAMDAAGKDSTIKHVMSGVNPQGCDVHAFKAPSTEELDHDYLWRSVAALPERGRIGIHNRSYYEEVIVTRVHPELIDHQHLPSATRGKTLWKRRFREINRFERYLTDNGVLVLKFFLHVSKEEQKRRFLARLDESEKWWKFSAADVRERGHWDDYMRAYEAVFEETSTKWAPWYVVPADHKWFTRLAVADIIVDALAGLKLKYPVVPAAVQKDFAAARLALESE